MEDREDRERGDDRDGGLLAVRLDVLLRLVRECPSAPDVLQHRVVRVRARQRQRRVVEHRAVVRGARRGRRGREAQRAVHVADEELGDEPEAPTEVELAHDLEQPVVLRARERDFGREVARPVEVCGGSGGLRRLGRGRFFGFGVGRGDPLRAEAPDGGRSMVFEIGFLEL